MQLPGNPATSCIFVYIAKKTEAGLEAAVPLDPRHCSMGCGCPKWCVNPSLRTLAMTQDASDFFSLGEGLAQDV